MLFVVIISVQLNLLTMTTLGDRKVGVVEWYMGQFAEYGKYTHEIYQIIKENWAKNGSARARSR